MDTTIEAFRKYLEGKPGQKVGLEEAERMFPSIRTVLEAEKLPADMAVTRGGQGGATIRLLDPLSAPSQTHSATIFCEDCKKEEKIDLTTLVELSRRESRIRSAKLSLEKAQAEYESAKAEFGERS